MSKSPLVNLGLQALVFSMKGVAVTKAEQHALEGAAHALDARGLSPEAALLKDAALECAKADPLTEELVGRLRAAVDALPDFARMRKPRADAAPPLYLVEADRAEYAWQRRRDLE